MCAKPNHEQMESLRCCLLLDARTLLGDATRKNNPRKDRMPDLYCAYQSRALPAEAPAPAPAGTFPGLPDETEQQELERFYARVSAARDRTCDGLLLPVCIDPASGAALARRTLWGRCAERTAGAAGNARPGRSGADAGGF